MHHKLTTAVASVVRVTLLPQEVLPEVGDWPVLVVVLVVPVVVVLVVPVVVVEVDDDDGLGSATGLGLGLGPALQLLPVSFHDGAETSVNQVPLKQRCTTS